MDSLSASQNDDKIAWYENDGAADPSFTPRTISTSADGAHSVYATDIDSDGDMDVLSASYNDDKIAWYESDGAADPSFTARTISTSADGAHSVYAADYDNDGDMDVLSASYKDDKIAWYESDGAADPSFTARTISTSADGAISVYAADIDNDGDMDVLSASTNDDKIVWYENGLSAFGDPTFGSATITTSADGANTVYAVDIDSDGDMDVLSASSSDDKIAWYENDGAADPSFTARTISTSADMATHVYAADIDNDGDMDVLSSSYSDDKIAWYENDGAADPSFTARTIATSADGAYSVYAADIDNDGDMDVLSASVTDDKIAWYESDGAADPSFTAVNIATSADGAWSVYAADIDNDGDIDVLSASSTMIRSPGTKTMALQTPALPLAPSLPPLITLARSMPQILITMAIWMCYRLPSTILRSPGTKTMAQQIPVLPLAPLLPLLVTHVRSTPPIWITMAIWMCFPPRTTMIRSPGTKTMALQTPALPPELFLRPLMERMRSTPQILITMAIWMFFPHQLLTIRSPGTKMAKQM